MSDAAENTTNPLENQVPQVYLMDQDAIEKASKSKEYRDGVNVLVEVVGVERVFDEGTGKPVQTKAGALKGTPIVNLKLAVFADPNDVKTKIDSPMLWHRQSLPVALEPGLRLDNQAMGIANSQINALSGGEVARVKRGDAQASISAAFNATQEYGLKIWQDPKITLGKRFVVTVERSAPSADGKVFTNPKNLRRELWENEKFATADQLFIEQ